MYFSLGSIVVCFCGDIISTTTEEWAFHIFFMILGVLLQAEIVTFSSTYFSSNNSKTVVCTAIR